MESNNSVNTGKIAVLFGTLLLGFLFFLSATYHTIITKRDLPRLYTSKAESATRGNIYSKDGFMLASSKKLYKAIVNTYNIDPKKRELFIKLFSIYSGMEIEEIKKVLKEERGNVVLSYNIDSKTAKQLKRLAIKLNRMSVFREYEDSKGRSYKYGLSIVESGEKREYLYEDSCEPLIGYVKKFEDKDDITKVKGVKGVEKFYDYRLEPIKDGYIEGQRDIGFDIILSKDSIIKNRIDGLSLNLSIYLKLQKKIERILDRHKKRLNAKEVVAAIMNSADGRLYAIASSNRFDPNSIRVEDYPNLNPSFSEYSFEPGSVIKPIVFSLMLDKNLINPLETIELHKGRYRLKRKVITDTHPEERSTVEDVIVHSSNIGMAKLAQSLSPSNYYNGLKEFGFSQKSSVDLPYEQSGVIPNAGMLRDEIYKATVAYGYGMRATFIQILSAYNVFNNNGELLRPKILESLVDQNGRVYVEESGEERRGVISSGTANTMKQILIKTVLRGTGRGTLVEGVEVGGKTGTAHIAEGGRYVDKYNSSFFGFANDKKSKYTIGVAVFEPDAKEEYFASQTAVPVFKELIELLIHENFLKREVEVINPPKEES